MDNSFVIGLASWFFPGAGHLMQGKINRGLIIGGAIWLMFIVAILSGGAHYPGVGFKDGTLLFLLNVFAKFGNGLGMIISYFVGTTGSSSEYAALATFEYGGRFLETAGLLNFLAVIDAMDINLGRKK